MTKEEKIRLCGIKCHGRICSHCPAEKTCYERPGGFSDMTDAEIDEILACFGYHLGPSEEPHEEPQNSGLPYGRYPDGFDKNRSINREESKHA